MKKEEDLMQNPNIPYQTLLNDVRKIIEAGRKEAYIAINQAAVFTYWNIGKKIVEEEQNGKSRAEYGKQIIKVLAAELSIEYGNTFNKRNLDYYRQFYLSFNDFEIVNTRVHNLSWSHFRRLLSVANPEARMWYLKEASEQMWSVRNNCREAQ